MENCNYFVFEIFKNLPFRLNITQRYASFPLSEEKEENISREDWIFERKITPVTGRRRGEDSTLRRISCLRRLPLPLGLIPLALSPSFPHRLSTLPPVISSPLVSRVYRVCAPRFPSRATSPPPSEQGREGSSSSRVPTRNSDNGLRFDFASGFSSTPPFFRPPLLVTFAWKRGGGGGGGGERASTKTTQAAYERGCAVSIIYRGKVGLRFLDSVARFNDSTRPVPRCSRGIGRCLFVDSCLSRLDKVGIVDGMGRFVVGSFQ